MSNVPVYRSSRFSAGNMLFRDQIRLEADKVVFVKNHFIGDVEHSIAYEQLASISIGIFGVLLCYGLLLLLPLLLMLR